MNNCLHKLELQQKMVCRKNVDYNGFELILALFACNPNIKNKEDIMNSSLDEYKFMLLGCSDKEFDEYIKDINSRDDISVENYINNIRKQFHKIITDKIKHVYLEGKKITSKKIKDINKNNNSKKAKADIYIETENTKIIGFSVKQDAYCTKTNYSVEKILGELVNIKLRKELSQKRKDILLSVGINGKNIKNNRDKANKLFYNSLEGSNEYWNLIRESIKNNNDSIKKYLVENIFPLGLMYELYEFNGTSFERLDEINNEEIKFYECTDYYFDNNENRRKAAKMFYKLIVYNNIYRIEIRYKGNIWSSSPQFLTHFECIHRK